MLQHGLSCAEGAGYTESAALGHRQEGINAADFGYESIVGAQALLIAAYGLLYRPGEDHGKLFFLALVIFQHRHGVPDVIHALFPDGFHPPLVLHIEGNHDLMAEQSFGHTAHRIAGSDKVTGPHQRSELPIPVGDGIQIYTPLQEEATLFCQLGQRILQPVKHLGQQTGAQLNAHQVAGELNLVANPDAACHFVDLHTGCVAVDANDLALEPLAIHQDIAHLVFSHGAGKGGGHQIPVHSGHKSCYFVHFDSPVSL